MTHQGWINLLQFLWSSVHDFVYAGIGFGIITCRFHFWKKTNKTLEERVTALEQLKG